MFVSILNGIILLGLSQVVLLGMLADMTAEEAQRTYPLLFDSFFLAVTIVTFFALSRKMVKRIEKMNQNVSQIAEGKMKELEFEPFFKGENSKEYRTESKGLGLAIVKEIVTIHDGKIYTECDKESGRITFIVEFLKD